jgi:dTDP-4-amino-4,6-dideoxygalactose transaminase
MTLRPLRTLPAVGHKIPARSQMDDKLRSDGERMDLGLFKTAHSTIFTSSGSAALLVALQACKSISSRRKVILPAYTCPSVLAAVEQAGLQAVLCDLAPGMLGLDRKQLRLLLDSNTIAVIYVHLFGLDVGVTQIYEITKSAGALMIEDAAQAFGNQVNGRYLGSEGDLTILSFGRGKPLSALHGGAIVVNNGTLVQSSIAAFKELETPLPRWFGLYYRMLLMAYNILFDPKWFSLPQKLPLYRIGETVYIDRVDVHEMANPARITLASLLPMRERIQRGRAQVAQSFARQLKSSEALFSYIPNHMEMLTGPLRFPLVFKNPSHKRSCLQRLTDLRLGASGSYPVPLNMQAGVPGHIAKQGPFPNANHIAECIMTLPTHEYVTARDVAAMVRTIEAMTS